MFGRSYWIWQRSSRGKALFGALLLLLGLFFESRDLMKRHLLGPFILVGTVL